MRKVLYNGMRFVKVKLTPLWRVLNRPIFLTNGDGKSQFMICTVHRAFNGFN